MTSPNIDESSQSLFYLSYSNEFRQSLRKERIQEVFSSSRKERFAKMSSEGSLSNLAPSKKESSNHSKQISPFLVSLPIDDPRNDLREMSFLIKRLQILPSKWNEQELYEIVDRAIDIIMKSSNSEDQIKALVTEDFITVMEKLFQENKFSSQKVFNNLLQ